MTLLPIPDFCQNQRVGVAYVSVWCKSVGSSQIISQCKYSVYSRREIWRQGAFYFAYFGFQINLNACVMCCRCRNYWTAYFFFFLWILFQAPSDLSSVKRSAPAELLYWGIKFDLSANLNKFDSVIWLETQLNVWKEEYKIFRSSALCLWCHASPRIVLPSCERGIREARGCKRVRANSKLWHSTCKPPPDRSAVLHSMTSDPCQHEPLKSDIFHRRLSAPHGIFAASSRVGREETREQRRWASLNKQYHLLFDDHFYLSVNISYVTWWSL